MSEIVMGRTWEGRRDGCYEAAVALSGWCGTPGPDSEQNLFGLQKKV